MAATAAKRPGLSNIPLRRTNSKSGNLTPSPKTPPISEETNRWKIKFDESDRKRKSLIVQNEKSLRNIHELEKKCFQLQSKHEELETELFEKNESLTKLTTVSKNLFQEYEILKNKYETEISAMERALNDASHWYKENKVLKRRTLLIDKDTVDEGVDTDENSCDNDLDNLRDSVKQLSQEVAELQTELSNAKLLEFETAEVNANLTQELELEKQKTKTLETELEELKQNNAQILRVSNMLKRELEDLKEKEMKERENADLFRKEANNYKKERNVLAHQSTILLQGVSTEESMDLLKEIEDLKRSLEDERNRYNLEVAALQEKLEEQDNNSYAEILEERLKIVEAELQHAIERAEKAERALIAPPPPPPPPPPQLMPLSQQPPVVPIRTKKKNSITETEQTINAQPTAVDAKKPVVGVNDDIINAIKGGTFTLRKSKSENKNKKERDTPKAVTEMLNVLGSLRRVNRKQNRLSTNFADVQL